MKIIKSLLLMLIPLTSIGQKINFKDGNYAPDSRILNVRRTVVDTLKADSMFEAMKPLLWDEYNKGLERLNKCRGLISMQGKKVTASDELDFLAYSYDFAITYNPNLRKYKSKNPIGVAYLIPIVGMVVNSGRDGQRYEVDDKNIKKGKITSDVVRYLQCYSDYLTDSLKNVESTINSGWKGNLNYEDLPQKEIIVQMDNPYYRGLWYNNADTLDMVERYQQIHGWEFLYTGNRTYREDSYPQKVKYYIYDSAPKYKVTYSDSGIKEVYNSSGQLVFVPRLNRDNNFEFKEIQRLIYLKDYRNNKYNIRSKSTHTQNYLHLFLERENGFEKSAVEAFGTALGTAFVGGLFGPFSSVTRKANRKGIEEVSKYTDKDGSNYIDQLRKDHENEFGYIYMIKRMSNTSFQVLYLNSRTLKPSYCAIITYKTGSTPFTCDYSAKLIQLPVNIPELVKK